MPEVNDRVCCVLFVCSRNRWRSPTAEAIFRRHPRLSVRSAGTAASARHVITERDVAWADVIIAMESKHKQRIRAGFVQALQNRPIHVLDVPDEYGYMDAELVALLEQAVPAVLGLEEE